MARPRPVPARSRRVRAGRWALASAACAALVAGGVLAGTGAAEEPPPTVAPLMLNPARPGECLPPAQPVPPGRALPPGYALPADWVDPPECARFGPVILPLRVPGPPPPGAPAPRPGAEQPGPRGGAPDDRPAFDLPFFARNWKVKADVLGVETFGGRRAVNIDVNAVLNLPKRLRDEGAEVADSDAYAIVNGSTRILRDGRRITLDQLDAMDDATVLITGKFLPQRAWVTAEDEDSPTPTLRAKRIVVRD